MSISIITNRKPGERTIRMLSGGALYNVSSDYAAHLIAQGSAEPVLSFWKIAHRSAKNRGFYYFGEPIEAETAEAAIAKFLSERIDRTDDGNWRAYPADKSGRMI